ncbi:unnamed protein product [Caenorhabditis bovis]|uniref:C2 domain-containing protein n=1 Tax=Caenorhabditis bovis TaxID=2654633 RepID=A0A8S1FDG9_9PELO|nr:unnamed protein product [Caenorhabditis bovis]
MSITDSSCGGHIQLALSYDGHSRLIVNVLRARGLRPRDPSRSAPNPFVKVYLLPGRKVSHKRRTRFVDSSCAPEWNQPLEYHVSPQSLATMFLEFTVCDYQRDVDDLPLGSVQISLADRHLFNNVARWYPLQSDNNILVNLPNDRGSNNRNFVNFDLPQQQPIPSSRHSTKTGRHATFNYNPVSLDIGYPAIN